MTFFQRKILPLWIYVCLTCMISILFLLYLTEHLRMPNKRLTDQLIRLHTGSLKETTLKYQVMMNDIYADRVIHLRKKCSNESADFLGDTEEQDVMYNIQLDQNHNLLYCEIQKIGSSFINELLYKVVTTSSIEKRKPGLERLNQRKDLGFSELHSAVRDADKFMFVREPYSRVLSGYIDKLFVVNTVYWGYTGKHIVSKIRQNADALSLKCGHDVTFPEFVKYVIKSEIEGKNRDRHFTPSYEHCKPCQIQYDFIGKMEHFKNDILFLLDVWNKGYGTNISFYDFEATSALQMTEGITDRLFNMKKELIACMPFYNATLRTWKDLQMRGIVSLKEQFPFSAKFTERQMTKNDFLSAAKKAIASIQNKASVKAQRDEAFIEAYSMIPMEDLYSLQNVLKQDFELFNYDPTPPKIFNRDTPGKPLKYFIL